MQTRFYNPHPTIRDLVSYFMITRANPREQTLENICSYPPTPNTLLFFYINDPIKVRPEPGLEFVLQPRSVVVGQQVKPVVLDINRDHKAVCIGFQPGGLFRLLGLPIYETVDSSYDARDIFGPELDQLNDQLSEQVSDDQLKELVEKFLIRKAKKRKPMLPFDFAMIEMLNHDGNVSIEKIASFACLSLRQFERLCKQRIGLSPRLFARLIRFSKAYRLHERKPDITWTSIAYESGYFDQMHLIRDFKEFAGYTPRIVEKQLSTTHIRLQASIRI